MVIGRFIRSVFVNIQGLSRSQNGRSTNVSRQQEYDNPHLLPTLSPTNADAQQLRRDSTSSSPGHVPMSSSSSLPLPVANQQPSCSSASSSCTLDNMSPSVTKKIVRFEYDPRTLIQRLLVSVHVKNKLDSSQIVRIPFKRVFKYLLLIILFLLTLFLTPSLLPRWLGFEWAAPRDLCQAPERKLEKLHAVIRHAGYADESMNYLERQRSLLQCMNDSAAQYYYGKGKSPPRFLWPHECTSEKAQVSLRETHCHEQKANVCSAVGGFFGFLASLGGNCVRETGPEVCVESTDADRADALLKVEQERARLETINESLNDSANGEHGQVKRDAEGIANTANGHIQAMVSRIVLQIDVAADAFIVYNMIAIAVGVPLIIYRREKGSMIVSTTFGLTKATFIVVFVLAITVFDSASLIFQETDFSRLFQNFLNDPCYIDPNFSSKRVAFIAETCNEVSGYESESDVILQRMDSLYYDVRLFGYCRDDTRELAVHPALSHFDGIRLAYRNQTTWTFSTASLLNASRPPPCNASKINELTSVAPEDNDKKWESLFGSGVIAQLLLKFILTGWIVQTFAYFQPMTLHNGKVEIWGPVDKSNGKPRLAAQEENAVRRFARDKHLLSLLVFSLLMLVEIGLIVYAIATTFAGQQLLEVETNTTSVIPNKTINVECPSTLFGR